MEELSEILKKREELFNKKRKIPKVEYEFQDLALQMVEEFGERYKNQIWPLFHKQQFTIIMIRDSFIAYRKQPVNSFRYYMGILNKKKKNG